MFAFLSRVLGAILLAVLVGACSPDAQNPPAAQPAAPAANSAASADFVSVQGRHLWRKGQPYYIVGANFWYGAYLGAAGATGDRERLHKELDSLKSIGINNLRVLAISEQSDLLRAVRPAIANKNGELNEELLVGLDYLLAEMAKRDMTAVLYLNNFWQWSGGMSQYVAWETGTEVFDPDKTGRWNDFMMNSAKFYAMPQAQQRYQGFIRQLISRTNSITGLAYAADPTIMSWQLANEPRPGSDEKGLENAGQYKTWIQQSAAFIKTLAPHQLVSTGSEGIFGSARDEALFRAAHAIPEVDYLTFHMWPKNWSWYDSSRAEETYPGAWEKSLQYIDSHIDIANALNKPIVIEEFGLDRDLGSYSPESTTVYRDKFYQASFARLIERAAQGDAIAGYNLWAWGGHARTQREDYMWQPGDAYFGDPPQEPQGLYSVFATDANTLAIIKQSAQEFARIQQQAQ